MLFRLHPGARDDLDLLVAMAPVFRIDLQSGRAKLIGAGFGGTDVGYLAHRSDSPQRAHRFPGNSNAVL